MAIKQCEIELEGCEVTNNLRTYAGMVVCQTCYDKEMIAQSESKAYAEQRVADSNEAIRTNAVNKALVDSAKIDASVTMRTDIFNAATVSISDLKAAIETDTTIVNKPYALAEELTNRFNTFTSAISEHNEAIINATNNQRAIQTYLNTLANSLRAEEREKLKIQDINYKPAQVKPVKPAAIRTAKKKLDKTELRKYAAELGIAEFTLQMIVVSKGLTVEQAANMLRKSINEAKSESNPTPVVVESTPTTEIAVIEPTSEEMEDVVDMDSIPTEDQIVGTMLCQACKTHEASIHRMDGFCCSTCRDIYTINLKFHPMPMEPHEIERMNTDIKESALKALTKVNNGQTHSNQIMP